MQFGVWASQIGMEKSSFGRMEPAQGSVLGSSVLYPY